MSTVSRTSPSPVTVVRWIARVGGLLFIVAAAVNGALVTAEMVGGHGPNWATFSAGDWATMVLAFGLPLVTIVGVVIAWLRQGVGEGIGGAIIVAAALLAMLTSLFGPRGANASLAFGSLPMALVGVGFLYCWWNTRHTHPQQVS